jgi:hypothetical protein
MNKIIHRRPHAGGFLLNWAFVLNEKQLPDYKLVEMQTRANRVVRIHHRDHKSLRLKTMLFCKPPGATILLFCEALSKRHAAAATAAKLDAK